ncbi:hypothetical protein [Streptomyces sp. NPDC001108]
MTEMRVLESTYDSISGELTPEAAEELAELARRGTPARESYSVDEQSDQRDQEISLRSYKTPEGATRWAVVYDSEDNRAVSDAADRDVAEAAYEAEVRGLAGCAGPDSPWWGTTDVESVDEARYSVTVDYRTAGEWTDAEEYSGQLGSDLQLSRAKVDHADLTRLDGAGKVIADALRVWVEYDNQSKGGECLVDALRVTVCGTTKGGPFEGTYQLELAEPRPE